MKKILFVLPLLLLSCKSGIEDVEIIQEKLPNELKGLKIYRIDTYETSQPIFVPILNNSFHDKKNISVVNKSNNEIIIVDEMISKNDSIIIFKINKK